VLRGIDPSKKVQTVYPGQVGDQITLAAFAEPWIEKHDVSHNVRLTYKSALQLWIIPKFGPRPGRRITGGWGSAYRTCCTSARPCTASRRCRSTCPSRLPSMARSCL